MLRALVRTYYKLRYLPRQIFAAFSGIEEALLRLEDRERQTATAVLRLEDRERQTAAAFAEVDGNLCGLREDVRAAFDAASVLGRDLEGFRDTASAALLSVHRRAKTMEGAIEGLQQQIRHQAMSNAELSHFLKLQARIFPSFVWSPDAAERARSILSLLRPWAAQGVGKVRIGRDRDGGYVMLNRLEGVTCALSLGIADDISWDLDIANRGIRVLQFDPTIAASPATHALISFEPLRIAPADYAGAVSLGRIIQSRLPDASDNLLLKMDIEGAEWEVCAAVPDDVLRRFSQIVCEFHSLDRLAEPDFADAARTTFGKLARNHFVCHVHGNNCGNFANVGNVMVPQSLEVTFANRAQFTPHETTELFPTPLDHSNEPGRADLYLGSFRFSAD